MDPELIASLNAYLASVPAYMQEYNRVRAGGDRRSAADWLYDHLSSNPQELQQFQGFVNTGGDAVDVEATDQAVPLEQDLLGQVVNRGYADIDRDTQRGADANALFDQLQPTYDNNRRLIGDLSSGALLAGEQGALGLSTEERLANLAEQLGTVGTAQGTQTTRRIENLDNYRTGITGNIDDEVASLRTGLNPVLAARLNAAGAQEAAVNLGAQSERDRILAEDALKGFVGGSSTLEQSLARASVGARQQAAGVRTDAQLANAGDVYGIDKYEANQRRGIGDLYQTDFRGINDDAAETARLLGEFGAGETRSIKDSNAQGKFTLFENDINRRLGGLALPTTFANDYLSARRSADDYSNSGLSRFLNNLGWFTNNAAPPSATPTNTQAFDSGLPALGAGIAGLGTQLLQSPSWQNLFKSKTAAAVPAGTGGTPNYWEE